MLPKHLYMWAQHVQLETAESAQALLVDRLCDTMMCNAGLEQGPCQAGLRVRAGRAAAGSAAAAIWPGAQADR